MRVNALFLILMILPITLFGRIIIVGTGEDVNFNTITEAVEGAVNGDTVKVLPGVYNGSFTISRDIVLMGSGYETTTINSDNNPTITMTAGKIMWFVISSNTGQGISLAAGHVTNCIIRGCATNGIWLTDNNTGIISNCVVYNNGEYGIISNNYYGSSIFNCISWANTNSGFLRVRVNYSCGSTQYTAGNAGIINIDPQFTSSTDFHISPQSPCWDSGRPEVHDPDGSFSDMGYFGGPDCPIFPVVTDIEIVPLEGGGVEVRATGKANY